MRCDPPLPDVFTRAEARAAGLSDRQIDRRMRSGLFRQVRRGVLTRVEQPGPGDSLPLEVQLRAALRRCTPGLVVSHHTAARVWGLPTPLGPPLPLRFTRGPDGRSSTRYYDGLDVEVATLPPQDVLRHGGLLVTGAARTVADCLRHLPGPDGLAMADAAVHQGITDAAEVGDVLARCARWPGAGLAARLLPLVDGRRESPLESWSALAFSTAGLSLPEPQVELLDGRGAVVARVDYWWSEGVAGEADGRAKYLLRAATLPGAAPEQLADVLHAERAREGAVRALGAEVERWGAADVLPRGHLDALVRRIRRAQKVAAQRRTAVRTRPTRPPARRYSARPPPLGSCSRSGGGAGE